MTVDSYITLAPVVCPDCGGEVYQTVATGPDYENHCCGTQEFRLVQCQNCQTVYLNPRPTPDMLHRIYAVDDYYSYDFAETANPIVIRARQRRDQGKIAQVLEKVGKPAQDLHIVDIGAGDGALLDSFHRAGVPSNQLTGVEIEQIAIDKYRGRGMNGILGQAETLDLPPESMDVFAMIQVIEHIANPKEVVKKLHTLLRPGGVFLIETPNFDAWDRRFFPRKTWGGYHFPRHWTLWSKTTMSRLMRDCGFEVALMQTPPAAVLWAWSINHVLQDRGASPSLQKIFGMNNPFVLAALLGLELIPSKLGLSANMRVIARKV
jgi:2-polyprenyl-3-methyl-5-hydroxy-6-metoxy-1,4-benzoquinol methylase